MKNIITIVVLSIFSSISMLAQTAIVTGKIVESNKQNGIEFATVVLMNVNDTTQVKGAKTKADGTFEIKDVPYNKYVCKVSMLGYNTYRTYIHVQQSNYSIKKIILDENNKSLQNITVTGEKKDIIVQADKKIFNVEKNLTAAGGTAVDALRNVPSVGVDMDGNLSLRGKDNVTLYIDGKPSAMFGSDPQTALASIPAASIENIEVITNPSSKYEAQGMNGIINIILKKDRKPGYNGMLTLGAGSPLRTNAGLNLNANIKKWNFFANGNIRYSKTWEKSASYRSNYNDSITYTALNHNDRTPLNGFINIGFDYTFNKFNKITFSENIFNAKMKGNSFNEIYNEYNFNQDISSQQRRNLYTGNPLSSTTNIAYEKTFKNPKEKFTAEINFSKMRYRRASTFETSNYDANQQMVNSFAQSNPVLGGNWNTTIQFDYTRPLSKTAKIEIGEKSYFIKFKSENKPTITPSGQPTVEETILKNHFVFQQQLHGLYTNISNQFNNTTVQVGLRGEYFTYNGTIYQYNASSGNHYLNIFPTIFIQQKLAKNQDLNLNYTRRVNRPNFRQLIPFIDVSNPQDTSVGNPNLKAEFIHATEVTYTHNYQQNASFIASAYYQFTNNLIQRYRRFNTDGTTFSQNQNLAKGITYGLEITNKFNLLSWWDATLNINMFKNIIEGNNIDASLNSKGYGGFGKLTTNAKLKYGMSLQMIGNYNAKTVIAQGYVEPYYNIDLALKKSFYKNLINVTINATDIFNTLQTKTIYELYPLYQQSVLRKNQTRSIGINLQIKFASKSNRNSAPPAPRKSNKKDKEKEGKSRDENLKKDEDGGNDEGGSQKQ